MKTRILMRTTAVACALSASSAQAQFGNMLQKLGEQVQKQQSGQAQPQRQQNSPAASPVGGSRSGNVLAAPASWCDVQAGALKGLKPDTALVAQEFRIANLEEFFGLFDQQIKSRRAVSRTFPNAAFFKQNFETVRVRALFDNFLAFPEPAVLAALVSLTNDQDAQTKGDAHMALALLHMQAPALSVTKDRWWTHFQAALAQENYLAIVFSARMSAYGDLGVRKNLSEALGLLVQAGEIPTKRRTGDGIGIAQEWDTMNYEWVHTQTAKDIYYNEPNMPFRAQWQGPAQNAMQIEQAQKAFMEQQLPRLRVGKLTVEARRLNVLASQQGLGIIGDSQEQNRLKGQLQSAQSMQNVGAQTNTYRDATADVDVQMLRAMQASKSIDDRQKQVLKEAQETRMAAQGILAQANLELFNMMLGSMNKGIMQMAAMAPAFMQANEELIRSCAFTAKWEQAMRTKDVPMADKNRAVSQVNDINKKYTD